MMGQRHGKSGRIIRSYFYFTSVEKSAKKISRIHMEHPTDVDRTDKGDHHEKALVVICLIEIAIIC